MINKNLKRLFEAFDGLGKLPRRLARYGCILAVIVLVAGLVMLLLNGSVLAYSTYMDLVAKSLVKTSFTVGAEVIVGALAMDYVFKR